MKFERTAFRLLVALTMLAALSLGGTAALAQTDPYGGGQPTAEPTVIGDDDAKGPDDTKGPDVDEDTSVPTDDTDVLGTNETRDVPTGGGDGVSDTAAETQTRPPAGVLPFTGGDLIVFLLIGGTAIALGAALWKRSAHQQS